VRKEGPRLGARPGPGAPAAAVDPIPQDVRDVTRPENHGRAPTAGAARDQLAVEDRAVEGSQAATVLRRARHPGPAIVSDPERRPAGRSCDPMPRQLAVRQGLVEDPTVLGGDHGLEAVARTAGAQ